MTIPEEAVIELEHQEKHGYSMTCCPCCHQLFLVKHLTDQEKQLMEFRISATAFGDIPPLAIPSKEERRQMKLVYICHPFSGIPEEIAHNIESVREICKSVASPEVMPIAPHLYLPQFVDEETQRDLAIKFCQELIGLCDEIWVFGKRRTQGMLIELAEADFHEIPVVEK